MKLNADPRCAVPQCCRAYGDGLCRKCAQKCGADERSAPARREKKAVAALNAAMSSRYQKMRRKKPKPAPSWCPEELAEMYRDVLGACASNRGEARRIIEDHMRVRGIAAPNQGEQQHGTQS